MKKFIVSIAATAAIICVGFQPASAYYKVESCISKMYTNPATGQPTGCFQIFTLITDIGQDGSVTYISSGFSNVGTNCPPSIGSPNNSNCPTIICHGITFMTQPGAKQCLGPFLCSNDTLFAQYQQSAQKAISQGSSLQKKFHSGTLDRFDPVESKNSLKMLVFPNPLNGNSLSVVVDSRILKDQPALLEVRDMMGKTVQSVKVDPGAVSQVLSLSVTSGTYNISLRSGTQILSTQRVIKP